MRTPLLALLLAMLASPLNMLADDMKDSKNFWMTAHSNYLEFTVLVTDLWAKNTFATNGYIRAYNNSSRQGTPLTLLRVYTKEMDSDYEAYYNVFAHNLVRGSKAYMKNTMPMGDANPDGSLSHEERTFYVNKGKDANDTFVIIDYYYPPQLAGQTWYFFYEYEHNSSGSQVMSLGNTYCSETVDCASADLSKYKLTRTDIATLQLEMPALPDDIDAKLQDVRHHVGHYELTLDYTLFDGSTRRQTAAFDCKTGQESNEHVTILEEARNFKRLDVTVKAREALEADGGECFWNHRSSWTEKDDFAHVPQPANLGADFQQFDSKVDLTWNAFTQSHGNNYLVDSSPYIYRIETDAYGTPKSGQKWQQRAKLAVVGSTQSRSYADTSVPADGRYYKYLVLNVPKAWENKAGLYAQELQSPSAATIAALGHVESGVVAAAAHVSLYNLQQDISVKDRVKLTWEYSRVPLSSGTADFEVWRRPAGTTDWQVRSTDVHGDANPAAGSHLTFTDADLPSSAITYDYKVVLKLNGGEDLFESNVVTAGLLTGTTVTDISATKGTHEKVVRVAWKVNQVGTDASSFQLRRRYAGSNDDFMPIYSTSGRSDSYTYEDASVQPGRYYEYEVRAYSGPKANDADNTFQNMLTDVGFCQARGVVTGRVTFGTSDTSVEDVRLTLRPSVGSAESAAGVTTKRVQGPSTGIAWVAGSEENAKVFGPGKDYTLQFFVRPDSALTQGAVLCQVPGLGRITIGKTADGHYDLHLVKINEKVEQTTYKSADLWHHVLYWTDEKKATGIGYGQTCYNISELKPIIDEWERQGYDRVTSMTGHTPYRDDANIAVFYKTASLDQPIAVSQTTKKRQTYSASLALRPNVFSLLTLQSKGGTLTISVDSTATSEFAFLNEETSAETDDTVLGDYCIINGCLTDFTRPDDHYFDTLLAMHNKAKGVAQSSEGFLHHTFALGGADGLKDEEAFGGNFTEVRLWDHALNEKELSATADRMLNGRESGLLLYWPLDEGIEHHAFDASYSSDLPNGRHARVGANVKVSTLLPTERQLSRYALTNNRGEYTLRGIPFVGAGTNYTLTPSKSIHVFSPMSRNGIISAGSITLNNYNFTDESSFVLRGKVTYKDTNIPVDSITFMVDGSLASNKSGSITTDSNGAYELTVPIGRHTIEAFRQGHTIGTFPADGTTYDFRQDEVFNFTDSTLVNVTGRINGGFTDKDAPLGFRKSTNRIGQAEVTLSLGRETMSSFNYVRDEHGNERYGTQPIAVKSATSQIKSTTERCGGSEPTTRLIKITTDAETGEFSALLPPLRYKVESITFRNGEDYDQQPVFSQNLPFIDATGTKPSDLRRDSLKSESGAMSYYEYTAKMVRQLRVAPTIEVVQASMPHGGFGETQVKTALDNGDTELVDVTTDGPDGPTYLYGHPLYVQNSKYNFEISVAEQYVNQDTKAVTKEIPADAVVSIINDACLSAVVYSKETVVDGKVMTPGQKYDVPNIKVKPNEKGVVRYNWVAGWPNLAEGYLRHLSIGVDVDGRTTMWQAPHSQGNALDLVVLGGIPTGSNFITKAPDQVDMVLRRPPGNTATASLASDSIHSYYHLESGYSNSSGGVGVFASLVPTLTVRSGAIAFLVGTTMRPYLEHTVNYTDFDEEVERRDSTSTYTVSTTMKTPGSGTYTQNGGDTYIGRGTNLLFSKGRTVGLFRQPDGTYRLTDKEAMCFANEYTTTFVYPQKYIENVLIPNWQAKAQSLLTEVDGDLSDDRVCPRVPGKVMYYTNLKAGTPRRGTRNIDDCWTDAERKAANGYPSYRRVSGILDTSNDMTDSIQWCNNQIDTWRQRIADNEQEKLETFDVDSLFIDNFSIANGTSVSQTTKSTNLTDFDSDTHKKAYTTNIEIHDLGYLWNNMGGYLITTLNLASGSSNTTTTEAKQSSQISWTISDSEPSTALSVNVYRSKNGWGPIFRTMGGQTSNPYEGETKTKYYKPGQTLDMATMRVENPVLKVDGAAIASNVPTGGKARFVLELANENEANVPVNYSLDVMEGTNPHGAVLSIDGETLSKGSGARSIFLQPQERVKKTLFVEQSNRSVTDYENIGLVLRSLRDTTTISRPAYISAHFVPASAYVEMSVDRTVLNKSVYDENKGFIVSLTNLDRQDTGLEGLRLQYRRKGMEAWTLAKEWKAKPAAGEAAIPEGKRFTWPVSMPDDGTYELRAQTFGKYGPDGVTYATDIIEVTQDLSGPRLLGMVNPEDGLLTFLTRNDMHIRFNEVINADAISKSDNFRVEGYLNNVAGKSLLPDVAVQLDGEGLVTQSNFDLGNSDFSIEGWVYRQADGTLFSLGTDDNHLSIATHDGGKLAVRVGTGEEQTELGSVLPANIWNYLSMNYRRGAGNEGQSHFSMLYVNADMPTPQLVADNISIASINGVGKFRIGGEGMVGRMHDIAIWDDDKNIHELYNNREQLKANNTPGLIGYWRMDEGHGTTLVDRLRARNIVMPTESWYVNNKNLAAHLDGGAPLDINISRCSTRPTDSYALELWFRAEAASDGNANKEATLLQVDNRFRLGFTNGVLQLTTYDDPGLGEANSKVKETFELTTNNYIDRHWHHLALNVRRGNSAIAYVDGQSVKVIPEAALPSFSGSRLHVGGGLSGDVDEVRIWNAMLTGEIIADRRYERLDDTYKGLVGYFPMESISREPQGTVTTKLSADNFGDNSLKYDIALAEGTVLAPADNAPALLPGSQKMRFNDTEFEYVVSDRELYLFFPESMLARMDGNEFTVTVSNVKDGHGNVSEPVVWKFNTDFASIGWVPTTLSVEKAANETQQVLASLENKGGSLLDYEILNLPTWMTVDKHIGTLSGTLTNVHFTLLPSAPLGTHRVNIFVSDRLGMKRACNLQVTVIGNEPQWSVAPHLYESNMILIGQLYVGDKICENERSCIAAFDQDGFCRGVARPQYVETRDAYYLNMNIYGASSTELSTGRRALTFKMYDASTGVVYPLVQMALPGGATTDTLYYAPEALYGNYDAPVSFCAKKSLEQLMQLKRGWNWMALYVQPSSKAIADVLPKSKATVNTIAYVKGHQEFATTKGGAFVGELSTMEPGAMYKMQMKHDLAFSIVGMPIDVADTAQVIRPGYNWIGSLSTEVMSTDEAFADLRPETGDVVSTTNGFAMYHTNGYWEGTLQSITPGVGYVYQSKASAAKTFHYPRLGYQTARTPGRAVDASPRRAPAVHFTPADPFAFPDNMGVIAAVVKGGEHIADAEVGAFVEGECRGAIRANEGSDLYFLTVMGASNTDNGKAVELRVWADGTEYVAEAPLRFTSDYVAGTLDEPFVIDLDLQGIIAVDADALDDADWWTLQGTKLERRPRVRGVYIHRGQKVVVR